MGEEPVEGDPVEGEPDGGGARLPGGSTSGGGDGVAPEYEALPEYRDAGALADSVGSGYWKTDPDFPEWDCTAANQTTDQTRDLVTGDIRDVTWLECETVAGELVTITVADPSWKDSDLTVACDPDLADPACFAVKGWKVEGGNVHATRDILERLGVDPSAWGV